MARTGMITNSKPIEKIPDDQLVYLFDLHTGKTSKITKARHAILSKGKPGMVGGYNDFMRRHYDLSQFGGQEIEMYHLQTMKLIEGMTLSLFNEIQKRNPSEKTPVFQDGVKLSDTYEPWKAFLALPEEVKRPASVKVQKSIEEIVEAKVNEKVNEMMAGVKPINVPAVHDSPQEVKPKVGRRKKIVNDKIEG